MCTFPGPRRDRDEGEEREEMLARGAKFKGHPKLRNQGEYVRNVMR